MPIPEGEIQRRLRTYAAPRYGYRRGADGTVEKEVFDGVLPAGWTDSPAKVDEAPATPGVKPLSSVHLGRHPKFVDAQDGRATAVADEGGGIDARPYGQRNTSELRAEIKRRTGKGPKFGVTKAELVEALYNLDDQARGA